MNYPGTSVITLCFCIKRNLLDGLHINIHAVSKVLPAILRSSCSVVFSALDAINLKKRINDGNYYVVKRKWLHTLD